jgi:hypothetical protein
MGFYPPIFSIDHFMDALYLLYFQWLGKGWADLFLGLLVPTISFIWINRSFGWSNIIKKIINNSIKFIQVSIIVTGILFVILYLLAFVSNINQETNSNTLLQNNISVGNVSQENYLPWLNLVEFRNIFEADNFNENIPFKFKGRILQEINIQEQKNGLLMGENSTHIGRTIFIMQAKIVK